jgi:TupA-like ATPgrasp
MLKIRKLSAELSHRVLRALPDKIALKALFFQAHGYLPNLTNPATFSERIQHRKLFDRDPLMPLFADKEEMKHLVAEIVGSIAFTPKTHWVGSDIMALDFNSIPRPFVVKPTHLCGYVRFIGQGESLDLDSLADECRSWLRTQHGWYLREWIYRSIPPRILVEEMLGYDGAVPPDYKLFVFGGKVEYIQIDVSRFGDHWRVFYDPLWNKLPVSIRYPMSAREFPRPATLDTMIEVAEKLGALFDFVRVDLYEHLGRVAVGELTFYPGSGLVPISPGFDLALGEKWSNSPKPMRRASRNICSTIA